MAFLELHRGKVEEVVSYLQKMDCEVIEHISPNALSHPYCDFHFRLFICCGKKEIKYVVSSVCAGQLEQLERVLQKCWIKPESIRHYDHFLNLRSEYERIFQNLDSSNKLTTLVVGARHGIATACRLNKLSFSELDKKTLELKTLREKLDKYLNKHGEKLCSV